MNILFLDGTEKYDPHRMESKAVGGLAGSLTILPRLLASEFGHKVFVASAYKTEESYRDVSYIPIDQGLPSVDLVIFNRNLISHSLLDLFDCPSIWWLHDPVQFNYVEDNAFRKVDRIVALSKYNRDSYATFFELPQDKFVIIPNGVDRDIFYPADKPRNPNLYIMASIPSRGIWAVEFIVKEMQRINPRFEMRMYGSLEGIHGIKNKQQDEASLDHLAEIGVDVFVAIPQSKLAEVMRSAYAFVQPGFVPENCSNLLLQAQACGLPVITSSIGSAPEFIANKETGLLTVTKPHDQCLWIRELAELCVRLYRDEKLHTRISEQSPWEVPAWTEIASEWNKLVTQMERYAAA